MLINEKICSMILQMAEFCYRDEKTFEYHMEHLKLTADYALLLNDKLGHPVNDLDLIFISYAHDLLKEKGLTYPSPISWYGHHIPNDLTTYVRMNLKSLEAFSLDDYFNTSVGYHAIGSAIFMIKEFNITDPIDVYPIAFHSCPIIPLYKTLDPNVQRTIDIIVLADKLSSNWLRINMQEVRVKVDLDLLVFGEDHNEFNYTTGLFIARMIGHGNSNEKFSRESLLYYYNRASKSNPFLGKNYSKGDNKIWPKRERNPLLGVASNILTK